MILYLTQRSILGAAFTALLWIKSMTNWGWFTALIKRWSDAVLGRFMYAEALALPNPDTSTSELAC